MTNDEMKQLELAIAEITEVATELGLDFYPMRFEICPADIIYTIGAYGMPTRFNHWSFGKAFHRMKVQYDLGLSKIYELVINSNPCYAFLLEGNTLVQNKLIAAHVIAHCDFFKNNIRFKNTNRDMIESMSASAERIRGYELIHGTEAVERFIDAALAVQEHIDPSLVKPFVIAEEEKRRNEREPRKTKMPNQPGGKPGDYDDLWDLDKDGAQRDEHKEKQPDSKRTYKDLIWFICEHARGLEDWQRDILTILREEMLYFWPQIETKIMNEGWASYWHARILRKLDLTSEETVEYAKLNAAVIQPSRLMVNPYYLGLKIFEDIEQRWGREKLFEVREFDMDTSFIRNYLTKQLTEELDLYVFEKEGAEWKISDKKWENVREQLIRSRVNGGFPTLLVEDGDYLHNGELYIKHAYDGIELDIRYVEKTLPLVYELWGKSVHLETVIEDKRALFSMENGQLKRKFLT
ncbi:MAG TPA: SpoVR family protein [Bacilli bacterium]